MPTLQTKLDYIQEILGRKDLSIGCMYRNWATKSAWIDFVIYTGIHQRDFNDKEIIWHPATPIDFLRRLNINHIESYLKDYWYLYADTSNWWIEIRFDLTKPTIAEQSDEVINVLYKILCSKKSK